MAALEGTQAAYCTSSGMAAISSVLLQLCSSGGHVVASKTLYGGTHALLSHFLPRTCNITTSFVDITDHGAVADAIVEGKTQVLYFESMANPTLTVADIPELSRIAHEKGVMVVVDNTFTLNGLDSADDKQTEILRWLDDQPDRSVVFLCFGSMGGFSEDQAKEIAIALERSGHRFIWCLRRATPMGPPEEFTNLEEILPEGFLDRTSEIGKIIGWAPQRAVLASPAIGGFVSHCGWNSILESLWFGVPIATWPLYAEQQLNAFEMVEELGLAVEIRNHFQGVYMAAETDMELMTAEEIERGVRCLMEKDSDVRDRVRKMSKKSHMAVMDGGSSHAALVKFIQDATRNIS